MPAKKNRRVVETPDMHIDLMQHVKAQLQAYGWVGKADELRESGNGPAAAAAENKARGYFVKTIEIEARQSPGCRSNLHTQH